MTARPLYTKPKTAEVSDSERHPTVDFGIFDEMVRK